MSMHRFEVREVPKEFLTWLELPDARAFKERFQAATEAWIAKAPHGEVQELIQQAWEAAMHLTAEEMKLQALEALRHLEERVSGKRIERSHKDASPGGVGFEKERFNF